MSHSEKTAAPTTPAATTAWPKPTLVALPPLRDLTLVSAVSGSGSVVSGLSYQ